VGLLLSPITYKCLLKVLYPVSRPITALDYVLLKDNNQALVASLGPKSILKKKGVTLLLHGVEVGVLEILYTALLA
jgi:hypothetical protein